MDLWRFPTRDPSSESFSGLSGDVGRREGDGLGCDGRVETARSRVPVGVVWGRGESLEDLRKVGPVRAGSGVRRGGLPFVLHEGLVTGTMSETVNRELSERERKGLLF